MRLGGALTLENVITALTVGLVLLLLAYEFLS
jgi:hypothetical protein